MSYLTESYQSFEDFRNFLTANDFEVVQTTLNTDNNVEYYKDTTHFATLSFNILFKNVSIRLPKNLKDLASTLKCSSENHSLRP